MTDPIVPFGIWPLPRMPSHDEQWILECQCMARARNGDVIVRGKITYPDDVVQWFEENVTAGYSVRLTGDFPDLFTFHDELEAMMFKMRWQ